ncbi:aminotransferase class I/II-fold pyridoxal phosphate-dependent enzyme [Desulfobacterales bacterium HSG17]|nr:aminotransferase class I/II-fold pyridoxal phosphate-dependent enzyme [Desulfobacterales bacterium HSG17]
METTQLDNVSAKLYPPSIGLRILSGIKFRMIPLTTTVKFYIIFAADILLFALAHFIAYGIRFEFQINAAEMNNMLSVMFFLLPLKGFIFWAFGLYLGMWRYSNTGDLRKLFKATIVSSLVIACAILFIYRFGSFSRAVFILDGVLTFLFTGGLRFGIRMFYQHQESSPGLSSLQKNRTPIFIIGADRTGEKILREITDNPNLAYQVVGFIDDDPEKRGWAIHDSPVLGNIKSLGKHADFYNVKEVFISPLSAVKSEMQEIIETCKACKLEFKTLPTWTDILDGNVNVNTLENMDVLAREHSDYLPFALPEIGKEEMEEVIDTLKTGWLTTGPKTQKFENDFAEFTNAPHALAVNSATAGLHLALEAVGIKRGDQVITTPYTFTASAEVIRYLGADPILVDIDPQTFNLDTGLLETKIKILKSQKAPIKAILPVHFAGQACNMEHITALARKYDLKIIEDAAHALPCTSKGKMVGSIGDISVFSFYVTKTLATGEGGMVTTASDEIADRIRTMRLHGINRDVWGRYRSKKPSWYYEVVAPGFKYNLPDTASAIGIHQLRKANYFKNRREEIAHQYTDAFQNLPFKTPFVANPDDIHSWHLYVIQLELEKLKITRDEFIEQMAEKGVGTSVHFIPLHLHPYWRDRYGFVPEDFPVALDCYSRAVSLPVYTRMTDADVKKVINAVKEILE